MEDYVVWFCDSFGCTLDQAMSSLENLLEEGLITFVQKESEEKLLARNSENLQKPSKCQKIVSNDVLKILEWKQFLEDISELKKMDRLLFSEFSLLRMISWEAKNCEDKKMSSFILSYCEYNDILVPFLRYLFKIRIQATSPPSSLSSSLSSPLFFLLIQLC